MIVCMAGSMKYKFYIGQHTTNNLNDGYKGSGVLINKYYKKYPNDYIKSIICYCDSKEQLDEREKECIAECIDHPDCLNLQTGGHNGSPTLEVRKKIGAKLKGRIPWNKGKHLSDEQKQKHSLWMKENNPMKGKDPWNKGGTSPRKGCTVTEETKQKIRESAKNRAPVSEKTKQKLRVIGLNRKHSEETKRKISEAALKRWANYHKNTD